MAHCFYIDATSHCANNTAAVCEDASDCPNGSGFSACVSSWSEIDFNVILTRDQPLAWYASQGLSLFDFPVTGPGVCTTPPGRLCTRDQDCGFPNGHCQLGQTNAGSGIPPVPDDPFKGSLKCIEFDPTQNPPIPDTTNTLKGEATFLEALPNGGSALDVGVDVAKYNAIGLQRLAGPVTSSTRFQIGGDTGAEYSACPRTLILNHLFDHAVDPIATAEGSVTGFVHSDLSLVPCGDDFLTQTPGRVTAQFFVFNEFEQRFSTSRTVDCFFHSQLSRIDTPNSMRSIFNANVAGTIAGQTRIQGVGSAATGRGLLGVARYFVENNETSWDASAAYNLHQQGNPNSGTQPDVITTP
jgi:hypothetical protein